MQSLLVLIKKLPNFSRIKLCDKKILLEAFILTAITRIIILLIPFKKYQKHFGKYNEETPIKIDIYECKTVNKVSWAVSTVSQYTPWESKCLVQAMTAQRMLKRRKLFSTLYLGVNKGENNVIRAHAWLRCGELYVTGGYYKCEFKEVAKFGSKVLHKK